MRLAKKTPAWHALVIAELKKDFSEINVLEATAAKRRAYLGLKLIYVKEKGKFDGSIPYLEWVDFFETNFKGITIRTAQRYMAEGESLAEKMGWQKRQIVVSEIPPHRLLELPASELPAKEQKSQQLLLELIEERGNFSRRTEYVQTDAEGKRHVGRLKGQGGATKLQRANAEERERQEIFNEEKTWMENTAERLLDLVATQRLAEHFGSTHLKNLNEAMEHARGFIKHNA